MDKEEVKTILRYISGAYARFTLNEHTPAIWYEMLNEQDFDKTMRLLKKHISTSKFEPTISDILIKQELKEREVPELPYGFNSRENDN